MYLNALPLQVADEASTSASDHDRHLGPPSSSTLPCMAFRARPYFKWPAGLSRGANAAHRKRKPPCPKIEDGKNGKLDCEILDSNVPGARTGKTYMAPPLARQPLCASSLGISVARHGVASLTTNAGAWWSLDESIADPS